MDLRRQVGSGDLQRGEDEHGTSGDEHCGACGATGTSSVGGMRGRRDEERGASSGKYGAERRRERRVRAVTRLLTGLSLAWPPIVFLELGPPKWLT